MGSEKNDKQHKTELSRIKSSVLSRSLSLAKLTLQTGAQLAGQGLTQALASQDFKDQKWKDFLKSQAANISQELGELKGSLMKAGQMLSMYGEHFLPPEANEFLKTLQADSPPLKWEAIEPQIKKHLSPEVLAELEIEKEAVACASLGQVHRARIKSTGEIIALKVQYPDVHKAIDSDLRAIKTILNMLKLLPKDFNTDHVFDEVRAMLVQEIDYKSEAELTEKFGSLIAGDDRYIVPKVYRRYSSDRILATSFERGVRADDPQVLALPQERRNSLAENFLDLYFKELFEWKIMQTDPHIGNYKVRLNDHGQDQLILLDFGATRIYEDNFIIPYHRMVKGSLLGDKQMFTDAAVDLKFILEDDNPKLKQLFADFCFEMVEPFLDPQDPRNTAGNVAADGTYDWKGTDLPQRISKKVFEIIRGFAWRTPPREILFLDRKTGGVFVFLATLRARINGRKLLMPYLDQIPRR